MRSTYVGDAGKLFEGQVLAEVFSNEAHDPLYTTGVESLSGRLYGLGKGTVLMEKAGCGGDREAVE
jgi:hypothetical protein